MSESQLIIVSNRLPVSVSKKDGEIFFSESSGGLATAMKSLEVDGEKLWIGWPGIASDELTPADKRKINAHLKKRGLVPVYLTSEQIEEFYDGYSNDTLWPLFHYFESTSHHSKTYWEAYQSVNKIFARTVKKHMKANDTMWVQDYHLMLLPQLVRKSNKDAKIGFFLHIPFPSFEIFRLLPERKEILRGLLGADLLGFHIYDYARHFLSSCTRLLGLKSTNGDIHYEGRRITVDSFPIGVDYQKFKNILSTKKVKKEIDHLREHYKNQKIILSVDRLDYTKGILHRLDAFEKFLRDNPRKHKKVCLVMVAVPSRIKVETYQNLRDRVEQSVSRINGQFGTVDWTPISYQFQNMPFEELVALYSEADVALVTPLRDGMNLVAKEYVATKQRKTGVLILSEMAGAIDELTEALEVNTNDTDGIALNIKTALAMPKREQRSRMKSMQRRISNYDVQHWGKDFIEQLHDTTESGADKKCLSKESAKNIHKELHSAKRKLLLLDYDGTLKNFTSSLRLMDSKPPKKLLDLIKNLTKLPNTTVYIISGRDKDTLESWFKDLPIGIIAEHGAWIKRKDKWENTSESFESEKNVLLPVMNRYVDRTPGSAVEEKDFSLVWHYRDVPAELAYIRTQNLKHNIKPLIDSKDIGIFDGNKIMEIKRHTISKGYASESIVDANKPDFILAIGDDYTDEDMFRHLPESAHTIHVGLGDTNAQSSLPDVASVHKFLQSLV